MCTSVVLLQLTGKLQSTILRNQSKHNMNALKALFSALNITWSISRVAQFNSLDLVTGALERTIRDNLQCWDNPLRHRCLPRETFFGWQHSQDNSWPSQNNTEPCPSLSYHQQQRLAKMDQQFVQLEFICPQDRITSWHHGP